MARVLKVVREALRCVNSYDDIDKTVRSGLQDTDRRKKAKKDKNGRESKTKYR